MVFTEAARRTEAAPSESDAGRVADAFVGAGVGEVWLFGSVARGESTESSDINLVAVYADLDYTQRWDRKRELTKLGEHVSGQPVDLLVTDLPEWRVRSKLLTTFERRVRDQARLLRSSPISPPEVRWDKEITLPASDDQEAFYTIRNATEALESLETRLLPSEWETPGNTSLDRRLRALCLNAQMAAECALKALVHLYGHRPPEDTHDLESLCLALPRDMARSADRLLEGIDKHTMGRWRVVGTYPANYPVEAAEAPALAELYVCAAVMLNRYAAHHTETRVGPHPDIDDHRFILDRISDCLDDRQLQTGLPRTGSSPLETPPNLAPPRPRYRQQDLPLPPITD